MWQNDIISYLPHAQSVSRHHQPPSEHLSYNRNIFCPHKGSWMHFCRTVSGDGGARSSSRKTTLKPSLVQTRLKSQHGAVILPYLCAAQLWGWKSLCYVCGGYYPNAGQQDAGVIQKSHFMNLPKDSIEQHRSRQEQDQRWNPKLEQTWEQELRPGQERRETVTRWHRMNTQRKEMDRGAIKMQVKNNQGDETHEVKHKTQP